MSTEVVELRNSRQVPPELVFDGFPYPATRVVASLYHITLLPARKPFSLLSAIAGSQFYLNQLPTCLVLGANLCEYYDYRAYAANSAKPPAGGFLIFDMLQPFKEFTITPELIARKLRLLRFGKSMEAGIMMGDLGKGGHAATGEELQRLAGRQANGLPVGLERCSGCEQWKGVCLDPSLKLPGTVVTVHCACDNHNLCAGCGGLLSEYKLNANTFDETDGQIWHVPGFSALNHKCETRLQ